MNKLTGEYECKIDSKGRVRLPASLIRQINEIELGFTLNRGFERHLILYPKKVWDLKTEEIDRLNIYNKKQREGEKERRTSALWTSRLTFSLVLFIRRMTMTLFSTILNGGACGFSLQRLKRKHGRLRCRLISTALMLRTGRAAGVYGRAWLETH